MSRHSDWALMKRSEIGDRGDGFWVPHEGWVQWERFVAQRPVVAS